MKENLGRLIIGLFLAALFFAASPAMTSGLDVQLKDLRNSFFYLSSTKKSDATKNCKKLVAQEIRGFGRLIHCDPEDDHVVCPLKNGEKLFAFEAEAACEKSFSER